MSSERPDRGTPPLLPSQQGLGDMLPEEFRAAAHGVADRVADYLGRLESLPVLPRLVPGSIRAALPAAPPAQPEPLEAILADYARLIEPNITHWQHPGFMSRRDRGSWASGSLPASTPT